MMPYLEQISGQLAPKSGIRWYVDYFEIEAANRKMTPFRHNQRKFTLENDRLTTIKCFEFIQAVSAEAGPRGMVIDDEGAVALRSEYTAEDATVRLKDLHKKVFNMEVVTEALQQIGTSTGLRNVMMGKFLAYTFWATSDRTLVDIINTDTTDANGTKHNVHLYMANANAKQATNRYARECAPTNRRTTGDPLERNGLSKNRRAASAPPASAATAAAQQPPQTPANGVRTGENVEEYGDTRRPGELPSTGGDASASGPLSPSVAMPPPTARQRVDHSHFEGTTKVTNVSGRDCWCYIIKQYTEGYPIPLRDRTSGKMTEGSMPAKVVKSRLIAFKKKPDNYFFYKEWCDCNQSATGAPGDFVGEYDQYLKDQEIAGKPLASADIHGLAIAFNIPMCVHFADKDEARYYNKNAGRRTLHSYVRQGHAEYLRGKVKTSVMEAAFTWEANRGKEDFMRGPRMGAVGMDSDTEVQDNLDGDDSPRHCYFGQLECNGTSCTSDRESRRC